MKKILGIFFINICILLCGCTKEKDNFEYYDLKDKELNIYTYYNDDSNQKEVYALADITPKDYMSILTGFFYQIDEDKYILLETLESNKTDAFKQNSVYQFYDNKLYGVGNGDTPMIFEIELNGTKSKIKELEFEVEVNGKTNSFITPSIKNIDNNQISFSGLIFIDDHSEQKYFDCSLKDYKCSISNQQ